MRINSFSPIADKKSRILILGSMPGAESLRKNEYYGHTRNAFWRIMFCILNEEYSDNYDEKKALLVKNRIALWDVIESCERRGSLDSAIKNIKMNDFKHLYSEYPSISSIYFNGAKSYDIYKSKVGFDTDKTYSRLPSTSPAHAIKFEEKIGAWQNILDIN